MSAQQGYQQEHNTQCEATATVESQHVRAAELLLLSIYALYRVYVQYKIVAILL